MSTSLDIIYQYRQLVGKCEADGLSFDEIQLLQSLEALFADRGLLSEGKALYGSPKREFLRQPTNLAALIKHRGHADDARITNIGPGGLECVSPAFLQDEDAVEVILEDAELNLQYRFKAVVSWFQDDDETCTVGLRFVGRPLLLRFANCSIRTAAVAVADAA